MRVHNFGAGPAALPLPVLEEARRELVDFRGRGMSVLELSHRSAAYDEVHRGALEALRRTLEVPDGWSVLLLQGGASLQFAMAPMNLLRPAGSADYVLTGAWSQKALAEARRVGRARVAGSTEGEAFRRVPAAAELDLDPAADYVHLTSNNTIYGTQWPELPDTGGVPLVVDASSDVAVAAVAGRPLGARLRGGAEEPRARRGDAGRGARRPARAGAGGVAGDPALPHPPRQGLALQHAADRGDLPAGQGGRLGGGAGRGAGDGGAVGEEGRAALRHPRRRRLLPRPRRCRRAARA